jgi:hypothetical protein
VRSYAAGGYANEIDVSGDRRVAVVAEHWEGKAKSPSWILTLFPPAAATPAVTVPLASEVFGTAFCTDAVLQVSAAANVASARSGKTDGPLALTLRDYSGTTLNQVTAPANGRLLGAGCADRTALIATQAAQGVVVTQYPL